MHLATAGMIKIWNDCFFKSHLKCEKEERENHKTLVDCDGNKNLQLKWDSLGGIFTRVVQQRKLFSWFLWPGCITYSVVPSRPRGVGEAVTVSNGLFFFFFFRIFDIGSWAGTSYYPATHFRWRLPAHYPANGLQIDGILQRAPPPFQHCFPPHQATVFQWKSKQKYKQTNQTKEIKRLLSTGFSAAESRRRQTVAGEGTQCSKAPAAVWKVQTVQLQTCGELWTTYSEHFSPTRCLGYMMDQAHCHQRHH